MNGSKRAGEGRALVLLFAWLGVLCLAPLAQAQAPGFPLDFETGDLRGWRASGDAFDHQPTRGDNPTARGRGQPSGHHGNWWIGTFEHYQGRPGQRPGGVQGDGPRGTLTSASFKVPEGSLRFLVGGGASELTRVELWVAGEGGDPEFNQDRVYSASGRNTETLHEVAWDLTRYVGKDAFIRIVDASSGGWGHINADDFRIIPRLTVVRPIGPALIDPAVVGRLTPTPTVVPPVTNRSLQQAEAMLEEASLVPGDITPVQSGYFDGPVIRQHPPANTRVDRGSRVDLWLAAPPRVRVPFLIDKPVREALTALEDAGLRVGQRRTQTSDEKAPGTVLAQTPAPGSVVRVESPVSLVIANPPPITLIAVPNLNGLTPEEAERMLGDEQLALGRVIARESRRTANTVIAQDPPTGRQVPIGTPVNVSLATTRYVPVPALIDLHQDEAEARLARAELRLDERRQQASSNAPGTVLAQEPAPHTRVPVDSAVAFTVAVPIPAPSVPATTVVVPETRGLSRTAAFQRLRKVGLLPGRVIERPANSAVGTVLQQLPGAGEHVPPRTPVNLWVATPKPLHPGWVVGPVAVLLGIGGAYWLRHRARTRGRAPTSASGLVITPRADPGSAQLQFDESTDLAMALRFTPVPDSGTAHLEAPDELIATESKDHE